MARMEFRLDHQGIAEILRSAPMRDAMNSVAVRVAANVRRELPKSEQVDFRPYTTDRRAAAVSTFGHGVTTEERRAALIRAARAAGLEVREQSEE